MSILSKIFSFFRKLTLQRSKPLVQSTLAEPNASDIQSKNYSTRTSSPLHAQPRRDNHRYKERDRSSQRGVTSHPQNQGRSQPPAKAVTQTSLYLGKEFKELGLHPKLINSLTESNFTHSTEVQERSLAATLAGKNIFCSSETGSGKTLSFLIPMIHKFYNHEINQALIICPTREIAIQIQKTLDIIKDPSLTTALVIGGTNMALQKNALKEHPKILVATPGRLLDMLGTGLIWLEYTGYVVLDEADRMLDMGFEDALNRIHAQLTGTYQMVLYSATLFPEIRKLAQRYADNFEEIVIGDPSRVATSVEHVLVELEEHEKFDALKYLIRQNPGKIMVFFNTIRDTDNTTRQLKRQRFANVDCIHSKISQSAREDLINMFREGEINVLLASDVAARGVDIPHVELVINFDVPNNSEEYIHRVGRTGRAGQSGIAITFYAHKDKLKLEAIEKLIDARVRRVKNYRSIL